MANEICDKACTNTLASIKQLVMTRSSIYEYIDLGVVGETDPPTPMGTGPLSVRRGAEAAQRADRGGTREGFYPASGRTDA